MSSSNIQPLCLLNNCKTLTSLKQLHANILKSGQLNDLSIAGKLFLRCTISLANSLHYVSRLFRHTPYPDTFMYNTLIRGLALSDKPENSFTTFIAMRKELTSPPDSFTYALVLKAATNLCSLSVGTQLHGQAFTLGLHTHIFVGTTLIRMYGECGCPGIASNLFDKMPELNVVAWNAVVTASLRGEDVESGREMFDIMSVKDLTSWNVMLAGYTKAGELEQARKLFVEMPVMDDVSWSTMIVGFAHNGHFDEAFGFFIELQSV